MTDRELLRKAAAAAGYAINATRQAERDRDYPEQIGLWIPEESTCWNPLIDSGHALRLAVRLQMDVYTYVNGASAEATMASGPVIKSKHDLDALSATRRAIVMAAAASLSDAATKEPNHGS